MPMTTTRRNQKVCTRILPKVFGENRCEVRAAGGVIGFNREPEKECKGGWRMENGVCGTEYREAKGIRQYE
jgi:hypothetical protein